MGNTEISNECASKGIIKMQWSNEWTSKYSTNQYRQYAYSMNMDRRGTQVDCQILETIIAFIQ